MEKNRPPPVRSLRLCASVEALEHYLMGMQIQVNYVNPPDATARQVRPIVKAAMQTVARQWHRQTLPQHFERSAKRKYGYETRSPRYTHRKRKRFGHADPLVYTGDMRRMVLRMVRIAGTAKRVRAVLTGPRYFYAYRKDANQPDKAAELTATTDAEANEMATDIDDELSNGLAQMRTTSTRTFR